MAKREVVEPTVDERGAERHPAWALIGASRVSAGPPGVVLFDSEIRHHHFVVVRLSRVSRSRDLNHDHLFGEKQIIEVALSEAQWASFVSSMNIGSGVPCTVQYRELEEVPGFPFAPRLQESMDEVRGASGKALEEIQAAFEAYETKKNAANLRTLKYAIANAPSNMEFAAKSLSEHAEDTVQKARADIEAMVLAKAQQLGLEPGDLGGLAQLSAGEDPDE